MVQILDGKITATKILEGLKQKTSTLSKKPYLAVILANDDDSSKIYVNSKEKTSNSIGFKSCVYRFDKNITQGELIKLIHELNQNPDINGVLVQLPLYSHLDENQILNLIDPKKDVDGFNPINIGKLNSNDNPYAVCCTPKGIVNLLRAYNIELAGKHAVVVGRSNIVGKPLCSLLTNEDATVTLAHSKTKNLKAITKTADILISATGTTNLITSDMVKKGAVVVDVGIVRMPNGKIKGDVDFEKVKNIASFITPVPGGVGPMTIASLMENTFELYLKQNGI